MPVEELQQATGVIIQMFPAMGVSMSSATAATAASSLAASVSGSISTYETATGVTGLVSTILGGVSFSTVGTIVLTAAAAAAIGAFIHWWVTHNNVVSDMPTSVVQESFVQVGNARGMQFSDSTTAFLPESIVTQTIKFGRTVIDYLPLDAVTNAIPCIWNPIGGNSKWSSAEDARITSYWKPSGASVGSKNLGYWKYTSEAGVSTYISYSNTNSGDMGELSMSEDRPMYIQLYKGANGKIGVAAYIKYVGKRIYSRSYVTGDYTLLGELPDGFYRTMYGETPVKVDPDGLYTSYPNGLIPAEPALDPNAEIFTGGDIQIDAHLRPGGLYDFPIMQPGDIVTVTVPVIEGATNISDISQITSEVLDNISENVLDGNLSPETVPEPSIEYEPAPPIVAPVPVPVPEETPPPTFDPDDINPPPAPPVVSGVSSTFIKMYNPTQDEVKTLASFMLSNSFVDNVLKLFSNPADYVIDISILPATVQTTADKESVYIGNVQVPGLTMYRVTSQYTTVDFGAVSLTQAYGNFVDYRTKVQIFLPYIGERELNAADVMGADLSLTYNIDVMSGACAALLRVTNPNAPNPIDSVLYQWEGNLVTHIPISNSQWSTSLGQIATAVGSMFTGGAAGFAAAGTILATSTLSPRVSTKGNMTANSGLLGIQRPYIILEVPNVATPSNYTAYAGRSTSKVSKILDLSGFVKIEDIQLSGIPATSEELTELSELLLEGVHI